MYRVPIIFNENDRRIYLALLFKLYYYTGMQRHVEVQHGAAYRIRCC
jgi:hypothetical protein